MESYRQNERMKVNIVLHEIIVTFLREDMAAFMVN